MKYAMDSNQYKIAKWLKVHSNRVKPMMVMTTLANAPHKRVDMQ